MVEEIANSLHTREASKGGSGAAHESMSADMQQQKAVTHSPSAHLQQSGQVGGGAMTVEERRGQERGFAAAVMGVVSGGAGGSGRAGGALVHA